MLGAGAGSPRPLAAGLWICPRAWGTSMSYAGGGHFGPESPQDGQREGGQRTYPQNFNDPLFPQPPPARGNRTLLWVLGILALLTVVGFVACCGIGWFVFRTTSDELGRQVQAEIAGSPEIAEHIGEIESTRLNVQAMQNTENQLVLDVQGSKGSGQVLVDMGWLEQRDGDSSLELRLPDGQRLPITGTRSEQRRLERQEADAAADAAEPEPGATAEPAGTPDPSAAEPEAVQDADPDPAAAVDRDAA